MKAHRFILISLFALSLTIYAQAAPEIVITTNRPDAIYDTGDTAQFIIEVKGTDESLDKADIKAILSSDGFRNSTDAQIRIENNKGTVTGSLYKPGILWIRVTMKQKQGGEIRREMGAAFSPYDIKPSLPKPADFDDFWKKQKARIDAIPMGTVLKQIDSPNDKVELYTIEMNNINDTKIYGYLAKPKGDGPFPAYFQPQWAGVYSLDPGWTLWIAEKGYITLNINAHSIENGKPKEYYDQLNSGELRGYPQQGRDSRETSYFLRMYLSLYRATEYLASRPEWDRKHFLVAGGSQGGGQTLVTAGLSPHVTAIAADVPALCDLTGNAVGRIDGWPRMVSFDKNGQPIGAQQQTARYFDAVNFVRGVKVPAIVGTGFADLVCPASSVYAAFNVLQGPKKMVVDPTTGHNGGKVNYQKAFNNFLDKKGKF